MYAYEMAAGVQLKAGFFQTEDLDTLLNTKSEIELAGSTRSAGLLGILQDVDKTFKPQRKRSFRAVNAKASWRFDPRADRFWRTCTHQHCSGNDLVAESLRGLEWLTRCPLMTQIVIAENGFQFGSWCPSRACSHCTSCGSRFSRRESNQAQARSSSGRGSRAASAGLLQFEGFRRRRESKRSRPT